MDLTLTAAPRAEARLKLAPRMLRAIALLSLSNTALGRDLASRARRNPCLVVRLPRHASKFGGPATDGLAGSPSGLQAHVAHQIEARISGARERAIAFAFLEELEPFGWLGVDVETIAARMDCPALVAERVLRTLQSFEPTGIFARSLSECLRLQAAELDDRDPVLDTILAHLDLVADGDLAALAAAGGCSVARVERAIRTLRGLDPKPGLALDDDGFVPAAPDISVTQDDRGWQVTLNGATLPVVEVREHPGAAPEDVAAAQWIATAVERRQESILSVSRAIVARQGAYLEGCAHPAPMTLADIADDTGLHCSTVSRVTSSMVAATPRGVLSLRSLFARRVPSRNGAALSVEDVRARIAAAIGREWPPGALSDDRLAANLRREGISIARRTVAKYRAAAGIPSAIERRRPAGAE